MTSPDQLEANDETFRFVNFFVRVFPKKKAANSSIFEELYETRTWWEGTGALEPGE